MAATVFDLTIDDREARQALTDLLATMSRPQQGTVGAAFRRAGVIYLAFIRTRFLKYSAGRGDWPKLAESTKRKRLARVSARRLRLALKGTGRKTRAGQIAALLRNNSRFPILRDTGLGFNSLTAGGPGNVNRMTSQGLEVGSAVDYMRHHQNPKRPGRPPRREWLVDPDQATDAAMAEEMADGVMAGVERARGGGRGRRFVPSRVVR